MKIKNYLKKNWFLILLVFLAFFTRFFLLSYPSEVVFDEVHFGKFVGAYFTGEYYFDIHPPLGKILIAGFAKIAGLSLQGDSPEKIFSQIGNQFDPKNLFILRFLPALFGALFVLLIYQLILLITCSKKAGFLGAFLVLFDNAFLAQSKFILVDIFLLFFGFSTFYFFLLSKKHGYSFRKSVLFLIISAVFCGLAFGIKWTGLSFFGIIMVWFVFDFFKNRGLKKVLGKLAIFILIPFFVYFLVFLAHFKLLGKSGPGNAYMSQSFQKTLSGNSVPENVKPLSLWQKFIELNKAMYTYNKNIKTGHPNASRYYEWPLAKKPIWYWVKDIQGEKANIYLLANPLVWLPSLFALLFTSFALFSKNFRQKTPLIIYILILAYFANLLPFILIGRVTFLYHYFPSLTFGIIIFSLLWAKFIEKPKLLEKPYKIKKQKNKIKKEFLGFPSKPRFFLYSGYLLAVFLAFLFLSPLTYGLPVSYTMTAIYKVLLRL